MARTYGSYMIQPTKDELRVLLSLTQKRLNEEVTRREIAEHKLRVAARKLGTLVLEGKIDISAKRLGELVIQTTSEEEAASEQVKMFSSAARFCLLRPEINSIARADPAHFDFED
jgi:hypothetical protein